MPVDLPPSPKYGQGHALDSLARRAIELYAQRIAEEYFVAEEYSVEGYPLGAVERMILHYGGIRGPLTRYRPAGRACPRRLRDSHDVSGFAPTGVSPSHSDPTDSCSGVSEILLGDSGVCVAWRLLLNVDARFPRHGRCIQ
jgi:hypothetical protein